MRQQFAANLMALWRSRTVRWALVVAAVLAALVTAGLMHTYGTPDEVGDLATAVGQGEMLIDPVTGLIVASLTAGYWGGSFRDGSLLWAFLATRSRTAVSAPVLLVSTILGVVFGVVAMGAKILTLTLMLPTDLNLAWWTDPYGRLAVVGGVVAAVVFALLGAVGGLIARNAPLAISVIFGWILVLEPLAARMFPRDYAVYFPGQAVAAFRNAVLDVNLWTAGAVVAVTVLAGSAVAMLNVWYRDVA